MPYQPGHHYTGVTPVPEPCWGEGEDVGAIILLASLCYTVHTLSAPVV